MTAGARSGNLHAVKHWRIPTLVTVLGVAIPLYAMSALAAQEPHELTYRWTPVYAASDAVVEVDLARVRPLPEGRSRIWTRWFWSRPQHRGEIEYVVSVILSDLDCEALATRRFVTVYKGADGEIVFVEELEPEDVAWQVFVPGTPGAAVAGRICELIAEGSPSGGRS